jgi:hypothetical protein
MRTTSVLVHFTLYHDRVQRVKGLRVANQMVFLGIRDRVSSRLGVEILEFPVLLRADEVVAKASDQGGRARWQAQVTG